MPIVYPRCEFDYEAAHRLPEVPKEHQCYKMHGHSYHLIVTVRGPVGKDGFVVDFADIKRAVKPVIRMFDHQVLNHVMDNPTVENQLVWLWNEIGAELNTGIVSLYELFLRETATNSATYRGEI